MLSLIMLNLVMLSVTNWPFVLNAIMLSAVVLNVVAPFQPLLEISTLGECSKSFFLINALELNVMDDIL